MCISGRRDKSPSSRHPHRNHQLHQITQRARPIQFINLLLCHLFVLFAVQRDLVKCQFISANNNLQVNRPLQRWEQFLRFNQLTPTAGGNFANPLSSLNNNLDSLFTVNPGVGSPVDSPISPIGIIANGDKPPTVVLNTISNPLSNGQDNQPNSIFISSSSTDKFRDPNDAGRYLGPSGTLSVSTPKFNNQNQDLRFTTNTAFIDAFKNRTAANSENHPYDPHSLNSSYSNSVPTKTHIDNFKELNHNLTRNHYIELSKKIMNLTLSITDSQFGRFLKFVQELSGSGNFNSDCMSTLISLFYGIRRQQSWALKCKY